MLTKADRREMLEAEVAELTVAIDQVGMMVKGSRGQDVLNPALAARRAALEAIRKLDIADPPSEAEDQLAQFMADTQGA
jgi:hypothetical protein